MDWRNNQYMRNEAAEIEVLGAILKDYSLFDELPNDKEIFYSTKHQSIFEAMKEVKDKGLDIDIVTLSENLPQNVTMTYLGELTNTVASAENFSSHLQIVLECKKKRDIMKVVSSIDLKNTTENIGNDLQKLLDSILTSEKENISTREYLFEYIDNLYKPDENTGIKLGLDKVDKDIGGLKPGQLVTIAGYTGMGKSILVSQIMLNMIHKGVKVDLFSLEMGIINKFVSNACSIDFKDIFLNKTSDREKLQITEYISNILSTKQFEIYEFIDDINKIISQIKKDRLKGKVDIVFIDLINRVTDSTFNDTNRAYFLGSITRKLKLLAGKLGIPIVITAQINRSVEQRKDKSPTLADVKESGGIAEDSDYVFGLYRNKDFDNEEKLAEVSKADYMVKDADVNPNCIEVLILKGRNIQGFRSAFYWQPKFQRIANADWRI